MGQALTTPRPDNSARAPHPPVELLAGLLNGVRHLVTRYVRLPSDSAADVLALWCAHAHTVSASSSSPRLFLRSAEKGSGKSRTLEVLQLLVPARCIFVNPSAATLYRLLKEKSETFLIDEADTIFAGKQDTENKDLQALLNQGYRPGASVPRCVGEGTKQHVELFPVFGAVAMASLRDLPDTTQSRSIVINMLKRAPDEPVEQFRRRWALPMTEPLKAGLARWAELYSDELAEASPTLPADVTDRAAELWEPLVALADLAGGDWPDRARRAASASVAMAEDLSIGVRLLDCIRVVFGERDRLPSALLCTELNRNEQWPWGGWHGGQGMGPRSLARELKRHRIEPKTVRMPDGSTPKGYLASDFTDTWKRHLGRSAPSTATSATSATQIRIRVADVADVADVEGGKQASPNGVHDWPNDESELLSLAAAGAPEDQG